MDGKQEKIHGHALPAGKDVLPATGVVTVVGVVKVLLVVRRGRHEDNLVVLEPEVAQALLVGIE